MAIAATSPPLSPPSFPPAADARDGFAPEPETAPHRSPVALRCETAGAVVLFAFAGESALLLARLGCDARGAVELVKTRCPRWEVTPAVAPLTRALMSACPGEPACPGELGAVFPTVGACRAGVLGDCEPLERMPLVVADP